MNQSPNKGGRPPGAKNKPKPVNLPAWNDNVTIGHRYGAQSVRGHHKEIYLRRLEGESIEALAAKRWPIADEGSIYTQQRPTSVYRRLQPGQIRHIIKRLADLLEQMPQARANYCPLCDLHHKKGEHQ